MIEILLLGANSYSEKLTAGAYSTVDLFRTVLDESLYVGLRVTKGFQIGLESLNDYVACAPPSSSSDHPSPSDVKTYLEKYEPVNAAEGVGFGFIKLVSELRKSYAAMSYPAEVYQSAGAGGATVSVIKSVPEAFVRSLIGVAGLSTLVIQGARNNLTDPAVVRERVKYYEEEE